MILSKNIYIGLLVLGFFFCSCRKKGCKDPSSLAYNIEAKKDDGSCTYPWGPTNVNNTTKNVA